MLAYAEVMASHEGGGDEEAKATGFPGAGKKNYSQVDPRQLVADGFAPVKVNRGDLPAHLRFDIPVEPR